MALGDHANRHVPEAEAEFDAYAENYSAGGDNRIKVMLGSSARRYLEVKADHLLRVLGRRQMSAGDPRVRHLDFGCGTGDFMSVLRARSVEWSMEGCDVSAGMLRAAAERHPELSEEGRLWNCAEEPLPHSSYDLITAVCVLHHIPPHTLRDTLHRLWSALTPRGALCIYEHNPWNPMTRFMVRRSPIDQHAHLISQPALRSHTRCLDDAPPATASNLLFFPPRLRAATRAESALGRIPLGGQYLMLVSKPT